MVSMGLGVQNGGPDSRKEAKRRKGEKRKHGAAVGGAAADAGGQCGAPPDGLNSAFTCVVTLGLGTGGDGENGLSNGAAAGTVAEGKSKRKKPVGDADSGAKDRKKGKKKKTKNGGEKEGKAIEVAQAAVASGVDGGNSARELANGQRVQDEEIAVPSSKKKNKKKKKKKKESLAAQFESPNEGLASQAMDAEPDSSKVADCPDGVDKEGKKRKQKCAGDLVLPIAEVKSKKSKAKASAHDEGAAVNVLDSNNNAALSAAGIDCKQQKKKKARPAADGNEKQAAATFDAVSDCNGDKEPGEKGEETTSSKAKKKAKKKDKKKKSGAGIGDVGDIPVSSKKRPAGEMEPEYHTSHPSKLQRVEGIAEKPIAAVQLEANGVSDGDSKQPQSWKEKPTSGSRAFRRVVTEEWLGTKGAVDNSYEATFGQEGWGAKANTILSAVRGKDFRHEKTKKKRGTYRGGKIDLSAVRSFKYDSD